MTLPTPTRPAPARPVGAPAHRHAGCYWDHLQAAWVAYAPLPVPRPARD